jgi:Mg-chelatase subunit ChlD
MKQNSNAITVGSLAAIANRDGMSLAESFLSCEVLVLIDQSGSMAAKDAPGGVSRFDAADSELFRLQRQHPGEVAVISFSSTVEFCPGGVPNRENGMTDMAAALNFARVADGASQIVLISDGDPNSQDEALAAARRYQNPIHTIYIGPEDGPGRAFLARLAKATGGQTFQSAAPGLLGEGVERLLLAA